MNEINLITTENNIFNCEQSCCNNSTKDINNIESVITVWIHNTSINKNENFDLIESNIENSSHLLKTFYDQPTLCEEYIQK
ncbi:unnamed protein product [Rotaria sp. Silwood2]|nr:unnamed protein product [Rotaria sp. Silwood2]CAF2863738.1 unnamed protein product [Rotaria sp. Silwood2]CAF3254916.1 unnamed protein product [Rotaria sp. Silwood2]CAF3570815.1 unnamed protein product [Rotaria sp. Silwood2]CAF4297278.1 unnamed protein product [Rotaria sp. Silwood2]